MGDEREILSVSLQILLLLGSFSPSCLGPVLSFSNRICRIKFPALTVMLSKAPNQFFNHSAFLAVIKNMCPLIKLTRNC